MKRLLSVLLILLLVFPFALAFAQEEEPGFIRFPLEEDEEIVGAVTPAMDMSLEEYYRKNGSLPEELSEELSEEGPFIPDDLSVAEPEDKAIFGDDDRIKVKNAKKYPYSAIGYMRVHASCGCSWTGTAFMVTKRCAMTAAHCLVCTDHGGLADAIDIYFGYRKGGYVYHAKKGGRYWYGTNFGTGSGYSSHYWAYKDWDYGFIILGSKVGKKTGWFGMRYADDATLESGFYEVCGYRNGDLRKDYTDVSIVNSSLFKHWADTKGGYSGCPVFDEDYYAVGINICHDSTANYARRITRSIRSEIDAQGGFG